MKKNFSNIHNNVIFQYETVDWKMLSLEVVLFLLPSKLYILNVGGSRPYSYVFRHQKAARC